MEVTTKAAANAFRNAVIADLSHLARGNPVEYIKLDPTTEGSLKGHLLASTRNATTKPASQPLTEAPPALAPTHLFNMPPLETHKADIMPRRNNTAQDKHATALTADSESHAATQAPSRRSLPLFPDPLPVEMSSERNQASPFPLQDPQAYPNKTQGYPHLSALWQNEARCIHTSP